MGKEDRIAKREKRKNKKKCTTSFCPKTDDVSNKKIKGPKEKRIKKKKGSKKFLAGTHDVHQRKWKEGATQAEDAQATVIQPGDKNIITDELPHVA